MKITYNEITKSFGIRSNKVRKTIADYLLDKYGENDSRFKDYMDRKLLLDELEDDDEEAFRPYGYAASPTKVAKDEYNRAFEDSYWAPVPQGYHQSVNKARKGNRDAVSKDEFNKVRLSDAKESERELYKNQFKKVDELNNKYHDELTKFNDGSRVLTPLIEDALRKEGVTVTHNPGSFAGTNERWITKTGKLIQATNPQFNIDPIDHDSRGLHERKHLKNVYDSINGSPDQVSGKRTQSNEAMKSHDNKPPEYTVDNVLDYINQVQQEELSANRGAVMDGYVLGGTNGLNAYTKDDGLLDHAYDTAELSQLTYDSLTGGYRPPSNRWNMDKNSYENLIRNKRVKSIVDEVLRPEVTGHIDL